MRSLALRSPLSLFAALAAVAATACSSPDPGALESHRAALGPGGSVSAGGSSGGSSSGGEAAGSSSGSSSGGGSSPGGGSSGSGSSSGGATSSSGSSSSGSSSSGSSSGSASSPDDGGVTTDLLQHCVDAINTYRAQVSAPAYTRSSALEAFAATGAQSDAASGMAHGHFISTNGGNGIAFAENEIPGWPLAQYGSLTAIVDQGFQMMWAEGPGGGHYDNMSSTQYTQAGCGFFTTSDGSVWITTDFR